MTTALSTPNGKTTAQPVEKTPVEKPQSPVFDYPRLHELDGLAYLRAYECLQLLHIITAAFSQADCAARKADRAVTEAEGRDLMVEALKCVATAELYTRMLLDQIEVHDPRLDEGPVF